MKPNADEPIDRLVRKALQEGEDRPVPAFRSEQTWSKLTQKLQHDKARRRPAVWLWAAGMAGLLFILGTGWYIDSQTSGGPAVSKTTFNKALPVPKQPLPSAPDAGRVAPEPRSVPEQSVAKSSRLPKPEPVLPSLSAPVADTVQSVGSPTGLVLTATADEPESRTATGAARVAARAKRRFQVMHINEYQAEEDAQPRLYRTESMVRLGSVAREENASPPPSMQILLPQRSKSNK